MKRDEKKTKAEIVEDLIERVEKKLGEGDVKASLADYIRLMQLQRELEEEEPKEIKVTWVDPEKPEPEAEKEQEGENNANPNEPK